ncbi:glycosyltransferase [Polynucleobacter sp. AP-Ainpum-60-G11]|uniref:glycosyltransferase n=1 Tax=Polynucleobacter sp. AP-Ainpum-60-G11 TaxID=2576926 RepID=UPI001BFD0E41|nr:glycosyltransferase [Polynucleobacter sp. AP-Ainpum-60-G11]QWE27022.1 glycosyltransferase [Polynucleobacter sp. AP-Ainpum-60-G11]
MSQITPPLVSIIINCFNGEKYLRDALDSVLNQSYRNWEIIFFDNCSTDQSEEIFKSYTDSRLKYYKANDHISSLYEARNRAIDCANGEYFAFLDVDDWWESEKLFEQMYAFKDQSIGLVCSNFYIINEVTGRTKKRFKKNIDNEININTLLKSYYVGLLTIVVSRRVYESLEKKFDPRFHIIGDFDFVLRVLEHSSIRCLNDPLAYYRIHGNNETIKSGKKIIEEYSIWIEEFEGKYKNKFMNIAHIKNRLYFFKSIEYLIENNINKWLSEIAKIRDINLLIKAVISFLIPKKYLYLLKI